MRHVHRHLLRDQRDFDECDVLALFRSEVLAQFKIGLVQFGIVLRQKNHFCAFGNFSRHRRIIQNLAYEEREEFVVATALFLTGH